MKSGRGGKREGSGRPATGKKEQITIRPTTENIEWLRNQDGSYSREVNRLIDKVRGK
jgi:hypothetical protein